MEFRPFPKIPRLRRDKGGVWDLPTFRGLSRGPTLDERHQDKGYHAGNHYYKVLLENDDIPKGAQP